MVLVIRRFWMIIGLFGLFRGLKLKVVELRGSVGEEESRICGRLGFGEFILLVRFFFK